MLLRLLVKVVVDSARVQGEGVGPVDHGRVKDDVHVAVVREDRCQVLPGINKPGQGDESCGDDGFPFEKTC